MADYGVADEGAPQGARRRPFPAEDADRARRLERLRRLAVLMDSAIEVPGLGVSFGVDPIIGLVPVVGDLVSTAASLYIVYEAHRLGASKGVLARMLGNVALDLLVGEIPVLGDVFDVAFKANVRNLRLLGIDAKGVKVEVGPRRR
jgi:hypothetical protein